VEYPIRSVAHDDRVVTIRVRRSDCKLTRLWHMAIDDAVSRQAGRAADRLTDGAGVTLAEALTPEWN